MVLQERSQVGHGVPVAAGVETVLGHRDRSAAEPAEQLLNFGGALPDQDALWAFGRAESINQFA